MNNNNLGFDNEKYLKEQKEAILKRAESFSNKLYLEFGGKLFFDYHAARVLPGYDPNVKIRLLHSLKTKADIILCIYAGDIERKKIRADFGITYDSEAMKLLDDLREWEIDVVGVVITRYEGQPAAKLFKNRLERRNIKVYTHYPITGYPTDIDKIVSDKGYGLNEYVKTNKPLIVVTGPGPGSGKLSTCLSQLYHDYKNGVNSGYAKFETFPIWNIPLRHPVNVAYEAATVDIKDFNLIDPYHLETYNKSSVNYNRDVEVFPVIRRILEEITGKESVYKSPTDMGVNCAGFGIINDEVVREAAKQEILRRYFRYKCEYIMGFAENETVQRIELLMKELNLKPEDRVVVEPARKSALEGEKQNKGSDGAYCGSALQIKNGHIITGKNSNVMHTASSLILNSIKYLAEIPDKIHLLSPAIMESISKFKKEISGNKNINLDLEETLIALSISSLSNPSALMALEKLKELKGCEVHMTHIPTPGDEAGLRKLGVNLTSDPNFSSKNLYIFD